MDEQQGSGESVDVVAWEPERYLRQVMTSEARLSRGFLRSRPERWLPGLGTHWMPLAHSLGLELGVLEVRPVLHPPQGLDFGFVGTIDGEEVVVQLDAESADILVEAVSPGATKPAREVVREYLARRFFSSLALCWSGPQSAVARFETETDPLSVALAGAVKIVVSANGLNATLWIGLGRMLVDKLDGLWRGQVRSSSKGEPAQASIRLEVAQLAVPPSLLADYTRPGTSIDLETPVADTITLIKEGTPWLPARLCSCEGKLGFEVLTGSLATRSIPEGTTRVSIDLGQLTLDGGVLAELAQAGVVWDCGSPLSNMVNIVINQEVAARALLCTYQGRFAMSIA